VNRIGARFRVTVRSTRKHHVVGRVNVAVRTLSVVVRNPKPRMVEGCACPGSGGVAGGASGRESRSGVVRIRRAQVIRLMATVAVGGRRS